MCSGTGTTKPDDSAEEGGEDAAVNRKRRRKGSELKTSLQDKTRQYMQGVIKPGMPLTDIVGMLSVLNVEKPPFPPIFLKAPSSFIVEGENFVVPKFSSEGVWHEIELGVVIGQKCKNIPPSKVFDHIAGYCVALDMSCPATWQKAREDKFSWDTSKAFDTALPVGQFVRQQEVSDPQSLEMWLKVNGDLKQHDNTANMLFPICDVISYVSSWFTLHPHDVVLTGSPGGITSVWPGDVIEAGISELGQVTFECVADN